MSFELKLAYKYFRARRKSLAHFTSIVAVVGIAAGLRILLAPILFDRAAFVLFTLAVMISSWLGGQVTGMLATVFASVV